MLGRYSHNKLHFIVSSVAFKSGKSQIRPTTLKRNDLQSALNYYAMMKKILFLISNTISKASVFQNEKIIYLYLDITLNICICELSKWNVTHKTFRQKIKMFISTFTVLGKLRVKRHVRNCFWWYLLSYIFLDNVICI